MSSQDEELESLIAALQADLPDAQDRERMRSRLASAGVAVTAAAGAGAVAGSAAKAAAATTAAGGAGETAAVAAVTAGSAKVAGLSFAAKLGWSAAVIASASALSVAPRWYESRQSRSQAVGKPVAAAAPTTAASSGAPPTTYAPAALQPERVRSEPAQPAPIAAPIAAQPANDGHAPRRIARASRAASAAAVPAAEVAVPAVVSAAEPPAQAQAFAPSTLHAEAELLRLALAALHDGDRAAADRLLDEHEARFPSSVLIRERERARRHLKQLPVSETVRSNLGGSSHE